TRTAVSLRVAIMAALSIADEYFKACTREAEVKQEVERFSTLLCERLEQSEQRDEDLSSLPPLSDGRAEMISAGEDQRAPLSLP
ncbi:MAG: cell division protein ZapA, partial [Terriglobia bacterium]